MATFDLNKLHEERSLGGTTHGTEPCWFSRSFLTGGEPWNVPAASALDSSCVPASPTAWCPVQRPLHTATPFKKGRGQDGHLLRLGEHAVTEQAWETAHAGCHGFLLPISTKTASLLMCRIEVRLFSMTHKKFKTLYNTEK